MSITEDSKEELDAVAYLVQEHANIALLFDEYQSLSDRQARDRRQSLVNRMIHDLRLHAAMEEQTFYPSVREVLAEGDRLVDESLEEHKRAKEQLDELASMSPEDPRFDPRIQTLISDVRHHVNQEEGDLFPRLRASVGLSWLVELGQELERTKQQLEASGAEVPRESSSGEVPVLTSEGPPSMRRAARSRTSARTVASGERSTRAGSTSASRKATMSTPRKARTSQSRKAITSKRSKATRSATKPSTAKSRTRTMGRSKGTRVVYRILPSPRGGWRVVKQGASRAISTHEKKPEAVARGRKLAKKQRLGQLIVHAADGKIQTEFTYGNDPSNRRG
jgi:hemerythrin superfamily protein